MNVGRFLSLKDFLNYYVAGTFWLLALGLVVLSWADATAILETLRTVSDAAGALGAVLGSVLLVVVPYTVGFTMSWAASLVTVKVIREKRGDSRKWVTEHNEDDEREGQRLVKPAVKQVRKRAEKIFGYELKGEMHLWFFQIRAYVEEEGGSAYALASRAQDLMNLTESLLLPVPLFGAVSTFAALGQTPCCWIGRSATALAVFVVLWVSLACRYLKLREYWAKHVYRAFLACTPKAEES